MRIISLDMSMGAENRADFTIKSKRKRLLFASGFRVEVNDMDSCWFFFA